MSCSSFLCLLVSSCRGWWSAPVVAPHGCAPFICGGRCCRGRWLAPVVAPHVVLFLPVVGGGLVECWVVSPSRCAAWVRSFHLWWSVLSRAVSPSRCAHGCAPFICGGRCCRGRWLAPVVAPHVVLFLPVVGGGLVECWVVSPSRCAAWVRSFHLWWSVLSRAVVSPSRCAASRAAPSCGRWRVGGVLGGQPQSLRRMGALLHLWWTGAVAGVRSSAPVVAHVLLLLSSRDGVGRRA